MSVSSRSVADPVRSGNVFMDIFCCRSIKDVRDATRTSRMGIRTIRTLTDEIRKSYGYQLQIRSAKPLRKFDFAHGHMVSMAEATRTL